MDEKIVVYAGSRNLYPDMVTAAKSLLFHNKIDKVIFLIEDEKFPFELPDVIETIDVSGQTYFPPDGINVKTKFTFMALMRAVLADILPYDKVLSLDIDTIVTGKIEKLWNLPLEDYYFAAVEEPVSRKGEKGQKKPRFYEKQDEYFNAGVVLYNLAKIRADGIVEKNVKLLNSEEFYSVEQDTMNIVCGGKILAVPSDFNATDLWTAPTDNPLIVHFADNSLEDWRHMPIVYKYQKMAWKDVLAKNKKPKNGKKANFGEKTREKRIVVYSGTKNVYSEMHAAVKSLLLHTEVDEVWMLIEDDVFPYKLPKRIKTINVSDQKWFPPELPNCQTRLTYMVLMRAVYTKLFPQFDKILQMDIDTIVTNDISALWDYDLTDYYFAAALEPECSKGGAYYKRDAYYQMGVCMMNLKKLREVDDLIIRKIQEGKTEAQEQGVFNEVCEGKILEISPRFNKSNWTKEVKYPRIHHFAGLALESWKYTPLVQKYKDMTWSEVAERKKWQGTL